MSKFMVTTEQIDDVQWRVEFCFGVGDIDRIVDMVMRSTMRAHEETALQVADILAVLDRMESE